MPGGPTKPLARNTARSVAPGAVAFSTFDPTSGPSVQLVTAAIPSALLVASAPARVPPPPVTTKVTTTPGTGLPSSERARTAGGVGTAVPTNTRWLLPSATSMRARSSGPSGPPQLPEARTPAVTKAPRTEKI